MKQDGFSWLEKASASWSMVTVPSKILPWDESQHLPVDIGLPGGLQLATDVPCGSLDVVLEQFDILEHRIVDPLQHVVG